MNRNNLSFAAIAALGIAASAGAVPINITVNSSGALLNTIGIANGTQYGQSNNNPDSNLAFLFQEVSNWNGVNLTPTLPSPGSLSLDQGSLAGATSYTGVSGFEYVVFHWGNGQAGGGNRDGASLAKPPTTPPGNSGSSGSSGGSGGAGNTPAGFWAAYYLGGAAINFTALPQINGQNVGGFSSARYYGTHAPTGHDSVPDSGGSLTLFAASLAWLGIAGWRLRKH